MKSSESILIAVTSFSDYRLYAEILRQLNRHYKCHYAPVGSSTRQFFSSGGHLLPSAALFEEQPASPKFENVIGELIGNALTPMIRIGLIVNEQEFPLTPYQMQGKNVRLIKKSEHASYLKRQFAEFLFSPLPNFHSPENLMASKYPIQTSYPT
jgi:hypothetical protein